MQNKSEYSTSNFVTWLTVILVSLSVGFSMMGAGKVTGALTLPWWAGGTTLAIIVGWVVIISTIISIMLAILEK